MEKCRAAALASSVLEILAGAEANTPVGEGLSRVSSAFGFGAGILIYHLALSGISISRVNAPGLSDSRRVVSIEFAAQSPAHGLQRCVELIGCNGWQNP